MNSGKTITGNTLKFLFNVWNIEHSRDLSILWFIHIEMEIIRVCTIIELLDDIKKASTHGGTVK